MEKNIFNEIISGNFENVKRIFAENNDVVNSLDKMKRTPLMEAIIQRKKEIAIFLIEKQSDVNAREIMNWTPLHFATQENQYEIVKCLIKHKCELDVIDRNGNTPLSNAVYNYVGDGRIIKLLLEKGADQNKKNKHGVSPKNLAQTIADTDVKKYFE